MEFNKFRIRSYEGQFDRAQVENLERKCEVGPSESVFLFTDTMGDPICRIRNSPMYMMLVYILYIQLINFIYDFLIFPFHFMDQSQFIIFFLFFDPNVSISKPDSDTICNISDNFYF